MQHLSLRWAVAAGIWLGTAVCAAEPAAGFAQWAATPPMGWNSYDAYGSSVTEDEVLANARYLQEHLLPHGWTYVVIDARWYDAVSPRDDRQFNRERTGAKLSADAWGRLLPAPNRFPSAADGQGFKPLADRIHALGLKFGIHLMRGIPRQAVKAATPIADSAFTAADAGDPASICKWCPDMYGVRATAAGQAWYTAMFRLYASWGLDFVKVDDLSEPYAAAEIEMIRRAIDASGRAIVLSTSPGPTPVAQAKHIQSLANQWRISGDFWDRWQNLDRQFELLAKWQGVAGPGHWPDADMIPLGRIGLRCTIAGPERQTRLTRDEQVCLLSLWCLAPSPLMLGMSLPQLDAQTLSLLTNDEVLAINQDRLGRSAERVRSHDGIDIWRRELQGGAVAVGVFNRGARPATVRATWADLRLAGPMRVRELWTHQDLGPTTNELATEIASHGAKLYLLKKE